MEGGRERERERWAERGKVRAMVCVGLAIKLYWSGAILVTKPPPSNSNAHANRVDCLPQAKSGP